jgi:hypothetical protein
MTADARWDRIKAAVDSLGAEKCVCGENKLRGRCFCNRCYYSLPDEMRRALRSQVTHGFEDAYAVAAEWLSMCRAEAKERAR